MRNEATVGDFVVGGQPSAEELRSGRFAHVVNNRLDDEAGNISAEVLRGTNIPYTSVPYTGDTLTAQHIEEIRRAVDGEKGTVLLH